MAIAWDEVKGFREYLEIYPMEDEPGYDGIHDGGIRGISDSAPDSAKKAYAEYEKKRSEWQTRGIKV